jgi:hypothetical protein
VITFAFDTGQGIIDALDRLVAGSYWEQVAVNHLRERVNMTHVVLSLPAVIIAVILIGIPLNWILGGTRTALQRIAIAIISVPRQSLDRRFLSLSKAVSIIAFCGSLSACNRYTLLRRLLMAVARKANVRFWDQDGYKVAPHVPTMLKDRPDSVEVRSRAGPPTSMMRR